MSKTAASAMSVCSEVVDERIRQEKLKAAGKFLWSCADNEALRNRVLRAVTEPEKMCVLGEEFGEIAKELVEQIIALDRGDGERSLACLVRARKELIQVAAVCVAWVESLDARGITGSAHDAALDDELDGRGQ